MTIEQLSKAVEDSMLAGHQHVQLVIHGKYPKNFPRGELMYQNRDGNRVYLFHCDKILKYLEEKL